MSLSLCHYAVCHIFYWYAECHVFYCYAECHFLIVILNFVLLIVIMLNVSMLNVVAPFLLKKLFEGGALTSPPTTLLPIAPYKDT
jgi:hypothetical protein